MQDIIRAKYGIWLRKESAFNFYLFTINYWENVSTISIFNKRPSFERLKSAQKKEFVERAFILWISYEIERHELGIIDGTRVSSLAIS